MNNDSYVKYIIKIPICYHYTPSCFEFQNTFASVLKLIEKYYV